MPHRSYASTANYRFGFNGKENDNEPKGLGNEQDYGTRIYDNRLGRWLSIDPLQHKFPGWNPYNAFINNPNLFIDPTGKGGELSNFRVVNNNGSKEIHADLTFNVYVIVDPSITTTEAVKNAFSKNNFSEGIASEIGTGLLRGLNGSGGKVNTNEYGQGVTIITHAKVVLNVITPEQAKSKIESETNGSNNYLVLINPNDGSFGDVILGKGVNQGVLTLSALQSKIFKQVLSHALWHTADAKYFDEYFNEYIPHDNSPNGENSVMGRHILNENNVLEQTDFDALNDERTQDRTRKNKLNGPPNIGRIINEKGEFIKRIFGSGIISKYYSIQDYIEFYKNVKEGIEKAKSDITPIQNKK